MREWRRNTAHSVEYYDPNEQVALAHRVCLSKPNKGLHVSSKQADVYNLLYEYLGESPGRVRGARSNLGAVHAKPLHLAVPDVLRCLSSLGSNFQRAWSCA